VITLKLLSGRLGADHRRLDPFSSRVPITMFKPSDYFILLAAFLSFLFSVYLWFRGEKDAGMFVGIWVPSILAFGAFVKVGRKS